MNDNSIAVIESAPEKIRNNDSTYRYRQSSNFYYLTGYDFSHTKKPSLWKGTIWFNSKEFLLTENDFLWQEIVSFDRK